MRGPDKGEQHQGEAVFPFSRRGTCPRVAIRRRDGAICSFVATQVLRNCVNGDEGSLVEISVHQYQ
ncbi:hypothetical protein JRQ81_011272 [Phrynocephalus forsythii]|uniref:Uncharacterized protein n=1 Tax=Phrynocephalus forsythii TaxID=171643 RepID=A0A9Q0X8N5_9SAUR|nr:hypothetical protein JRQ81_011272 [Phrynocephalus forsythii]